MENEGFRTGRMGLRVETDTSGWLLCNVSMPWEFDLRKSDLIVLEVDRFEGNGLLVGEADGWALM